MLRKYMENEIQAITKVIVRIFLICQNQLLRNKRNRGLK